MARKAGTPNKPKQEETLTPLEAVEELATLNQELQLEEVKPELIPVVELSTESEEEPVDNLEQVTTDPVEESILNVQEESEESNTDVATTAESPVIDSYGLTDYFGNPVPATLIKLHKYVYVHELVSDLLHLSYLGAVLDKSYFPKIKNVPFSAQMILPTSKLEDWENKTGKAEVPENGLLANVATFDTMAFINHLLELGKKGYTLAPKKALFTNGKYLATLIGRIPVPKDFSLTVDPRSRLFYSKEELNTFNIYELQTIGSWYDINHRSKAELIKMILKAQEEK